MKDYSCSFEKNSIFVKEEYYLYYEKKDGKITVYLSDGSKKEFPNSKLIEQEILGKMESQLLEYEDYYISYYNEESEDTIKRVVPFIYASSLLSYAGMNSSVLFQSINYSVLAAGAVILTKATVVRSIANSRKRDYIKHKLYLDNKEDLNKFLRGDLRGLSGVRKKILKEALHNAEDNIDTINMNTIRLLKLKELKLIIERMNNSKEKEKTMVKKRTSQND